MSLTGFTRDGITFQYSSSTKLKKSTSLFLKIEREAFMSDEVFAKTKKNCNKRTDRQTNNLPRDGAISNRDEECMSYEKLSRPSRLYYNQGIRLKGEMSLMSDLLFSSNAR